MIRGMGIRSMARRSVHDAEGCAEPIGIHDDPGKGINEQQKISKLAERRSLSGIQLQWVGN